MGAPTLPPVSPSPVCPPSSTASSLQLSSGLAAGLDSSGCHSGAGCSAESCTVSVRPCDVQAPWHHCVQLAELQGCPRLTCVCTQGPLSGDFNLLGLVIFHMGRLWRGWGLGRLEKVLGQGEGKPAGTGELTAPLLCGKKRKPQACPQAAGTRLPASVPVLLGHPGTCPWPQTGEFPWMCPPPL